MPSATISPPPMSDLRKLAGTLMLVAGGVAVPMGSGIAQVTSPKQIVDPLKPSEAPPAPSAPADVIVAPKLPRASGDTAESTKITVQRIEFSGNTLFTTAELQTAVASYLNRAISLVDIYSAADAVADLYIGKGYALATVNVPPQRVTDGSILLQISEGRVANVNVAGNKRYSADHVLTYLDQFQPGKIYQSGDLQSGLRTLNSLPGLSAKAGIKPGADPETSDVTIELTEDPFQGGLFFDNYGRKSVGEYRTTAVATFNNPLYIEDQLQLVGLVSDNSLARFGSVTYSRPINFSGTRLRMNYAHAEFEVDDLPVDGRSRSGELILEQALLRDAKQSLTGTFGATRSLSNADFTGLVFNQTSITLFRLGLAYTRSYDNSSVTQVSTSLSSNFRSNTPGEAALGTDSGDQRLKWEMDVQHLLQLSRAFQLYMRVNGAWSPDPLVNTEKYSLGGPGSARAFPGAELRGDSGYFGSVALRHTMPLGPTTLRSRIFADSGRVFSEEEPDAGSLSDVGLGVDIVVQPMTFSVDWAYPLGHREVSDDRESGRAFGSLSASF